MRKSTVTLGIDLGDRTSHVHGVSSRTGEIVVECVVATTREEMGQFLREVPPVRVVLETGMHSNWVARLAEERGHEVVLAQARRLRMIYENPNKSDALDAQMLAELGSSHPHLLHPVKVRSEETSAHLSLLRARENLVESRTQLVNAARGLVKSLGDRLPKCSTETFPRKARAARPKVLAAAIDPLLVAIAQLTRQVRRLDREVERLVQTRYAKETARVREVPGVGALTALAFVLVVGDPARFQRTRDVGAFLGLVPRRDQSGASDPQLPITKCGDALLRRLLVQSAHYILGPFGGDCDLRRWGQRRAERGGTSAKRRAAVAVARRLSVLLLTLWKRDVAYEPLRNAERAAR